MNGKIDTKADYQVLVKKNLGGMNVLLVVDKPSKSTMIGINDKTVFINHNQTLFNIVSDQEIERLKQVRLNNELKLNTMYELTDLLAECPC
ncbi:MAG: hypothetical protein ABFD07_03520 [Methanobacterium sp.]